MTSKSQKLLSTNIYDKDLEDKILLIGSCLKMIHPEIVEEFAQKYDGHVFDVCLEETHYNKVMGKLFNILALGKTKEVGILTVDGSPHCVQLHYTAKYIKRGLKYEFKFKHFVITKAGEVVEIDPVVVDNSKNFAKR